MSFADPLWEFVLEDYEDEESNRLAIFGKSKKKKEKNSAESWKLDWFDDRDDRAISNGKKRVNDPVVKKTNDKLPTGSRGLIANLSRKSGNRNEYRDDKEDGFWDVISGAPPAATIPKRSNGNSGNTKISKGRGLLSKKSTLKTSKKSSLIPSQSNTSESEMNNNDKKKNGFKKRFSWNQNSKSAEDVSTKGYPIQNVDVQHATLAYDREDAKTPSAIKKNDSTFDPLDLIFQIADSLDPWGIDPSEASTSEIDSIYGTGTVDDDEGDGNAYESMLNLGFPESSESQIIDTKPSNSMSRSSIHTRNKKSNSKPELLFDQQLPKPTTFDHNRYPYHSKQPTKEKDSFSTEIRLRVNSGGNTLSEEVYKTSSNMQENCEQTVRKSPAWDEEKSLRSRPSFDASNVLKSSQMFEGVSKQLSVVAKEKKTIITSERNKSISEEMRVPTDVHITKRSESCICYDEGEEFENAKKLNVFKKAVCGLKKVGRNDLINRLRRSDAAEVFPSSRVIIDGETHLIIGPESDPINGMLGVSSCSLIESKGPQSVFAYDYDSNMNMDVSYTQPNQKPRTGISVRKLGSPPPLLSSSGAENIVVQIEASTVSETDCIIRQGLWWGDYEPSFPNTPGIDVVGKVYSTKQTTGKVYGLKPMQTVLSLVKWGGNARFMTIHPNQLVKVPEGLDPAEVACLPECYLSAFQVLHMGQTGNSRYRESSMRGKSILILGSMTNNMGKAIIELGLHSGVANIYATAKKKHWKTLISYGVMPLSPDPMEWIQRIAGTMDLVLAPNGNLREDVSPVHFRALLPRYGQLIISGHRIVGNDIPIDDWKRDHQAPTLACGKNKALQKILRNSLSYDVYEEWGVNLDLCKRDLSHLLKLLKCKSIRPEVLDRLPLNKVAKAHEMLETKRLPGFLVCEPWMKSKKRVVYL